MLLLDSPDVGYYSLEVRREFYTIWLRTVLQRTRAKEGIKVVIPVGIANRIPQKKIVSIQIYYHSSVSNREKPLPVT